MDFKKLDYAALNKALLGPEYDLFASHFTDTPMPANSTSMFGGSPGERTEVSYRLINFAQANKLNYYLKNSAIPGSASIELPQSLNIGAIESDLLKLTRKGVSGHSVVEAVHGAGGAAIRARIINQTKSGKQIIKDTDIYVFELNKQLPHLIINKVDGLRKLGKLAGYFKQAKIFRAEGQFGAKFQMISPDGYEIDALSYVTPELIEQIMNLKQHYNLEVVGNMLLIMPISAKPKYIENIINDYDTMRRIAWEVNDNTRSYNASLPSKPKVQVRLKKELSLGLKIAYAAVLVLFVVILVLIKIKI